MKDFQIPEQIVRFLEFRFFTSNDSDCWQGWFRYEVEQKQKTPKENERMFESRRKVLYKMYKMGHKISINRFSEIPIVQVVHQSLTTYVSVWTLLSSRSNRDTTSTIRES